jgi:fibronectin type 3 domain-containing protein
MNCDVFACHQRSLRQWSLLFLGGIVLILGVVAGCGSSGGNSDSTPPGAPSNLAGTPGDGKVDLSWSGGTASDLSEYNLYRSTSSSVDQISDRSPIQSTSSSTYEDTEVSNDTRYYYVVTAVDDAGNESEPSNKINVKPPFEEAPGRP